MENADFLERIAVELHEIHTTFNVRMDQMEDVLIPSGDPVDCSICRFGDFEDVGTGAQARFGLCRRYAPRPTDDPNSIRWPSVRPTDYCGDGIARLDY
jgi:hypothetical protein